MYWPAIFIFLGLIAATLGVLWLFLRRVATGVFPFRIMPITKVDRPISFWIITIANLAGIVFFLVLFSGFLWSHLRDG